MSEHKIREINATRKLQEMAEALQRSGLETAEELYPTCPYCGVNPCVLSSRDFMFPSGLLTVIFFCGNKQCSKIISVQAVGGVKQQPPSRIIQPS